MAQKVYARDYTLFKIADETKWGFVQTNHFGPASKSHMLEMRSGKYGWVIGANWDTPEVLRAGIRAEYAGKLSYWYCITFKGFVHLLETFDSQKLDEMKEILFRKIFNLDTKVKEFIDFRF